MPRVFVSFAQADQERIEPILELLRRRGWSLRSELDIEAGLDYREQVERLVLDSEIVLYPAAVLGATHPATSV
jgi:hypothetical protein